MNTSAVGAGGTIAPAIVRDLAESDEVEDLLLLDIDEGRARAVAEAHGGGGARAARATRGSSPRRRAPWRGRSRAPMSL